MRYFSDASGGVGSLVSDQEETGFEGLAANPASLTSTIAAKLGISPARFSNWRWQMGKQLTTATEFADFVDLSPEEIMGFDKMGDLFKVAVTPYYAGLMASLGPNNSLRSQCVPNIVEMQNNIGELDPLREKEHSPVREVVHLYHDRVAFCVAMLCPIYCRYCYRKRRDHEEGLHYNRRIIDNGIAYIASNKSIKDVLITGGDPFIASDAAIADLLERISQISHVEIIRFGTRTPVTLPYRVTTSLAKILAKHHPVWVNTHFNCAEEITPEAARAVANLVDHGVVVGNQSVLLKGVNDSPEKMEALCRALVRARVRPYYVFHPHRVMGSDHLLVDVNHGMQVMKSLRGKISGFAIPTYVLDTPSGKVPLSHNYILGRDGVDLLLENIHGEIWREPNAFK